MKKLFVSVPMNGRERKNIEDSIFRMHKIAEYIFGEELELVNSIVTEATPEGANESVWYLSKSIEMLSQADCFVGINRAYDWDGCCIESEIARRYEIPCAYVDYEIMMPDAVDAMGKMNGACCPVKN